MIINAFNLSASLGDKMNFVTFNSSIRLIFDFVNPFAAGRFMTYRRGTKLQVYYCSSASNSVFIASYQCQSMIA